jgi:hypothetical protein
MSHRTNRSAVWTVAVLMACLVAMPMANIGLAQLGGGDLESLDIQKTKKQNKEKKGKKKRAASGMRPLSSLNLVAGMVGDPKAQFLAWQYHLRVLNLTWEDTGRYYGSCVGPNISDMTIQVRPKRESKKKDRGWAPLMPVIRFPNFSDITCDLPPEDFSLLVGNEKEGRELKKITLKEYLETPREYMTNPDSWKGSKDTLLAPRDSQVLVSAQACFLPIPESGKVEFNPYLFNYQSYKDNPAVLAILATREGTSMTVIDNNFDPGAAPGMFMGGWNWGQPLFFNAAGKNACLLGERKTDFEEKHGEAVKDMPSVSATGEEGLNMVLLIQVPLKQKPRPSGANPFMLGGGMGGFGGGFFGGGGAANADFDGVELESDVEEAVISHGKAEGPFTECNDLAIQRDPRFPVRVTVQFYKATSNGVVDEDDLQQIATEINRVYKDSKFVGSLVVDGSSERATEYKGKKVQPYWWWESFWQRYEADTGISRQEAVRQLRLKLGSGWYPKTRRQLRDAVENVKAEDQNNPTIGPFTGGGIF